jgi:cysteine desulfuration protein SufE
MDQTLTIDALQNTIIDEFALFDDWQERYGYVIELGRSLPPYPEAQRTAAHLVRGCQSQVWLHGHYADGVLHFAAASDALIVSGLVALLLRIFSGQPPAAIVAAQPHFIDTIGLGTHLSLNRSNGLRAMIATMQAQAATYLPKDS